MKVKATKQCFCAVCGKSMDYAPYWTLRDHFVYKYGELQYIEIAHKRCVASISFPGRLVWGWE